MLKKSVSVGLIGDYKKTVSAHQAIPMALSLASNATGIGVACAWVPTEEIVDTRRIDGFDGLWCVPASPYRNVHGALLAIQFAREQHRPFLGTCGGFQHAILEFARNVLGWADAEHAETAPTAVRAVIAPLSCSLVEKTGVVRLHPGTRIAAAYGTCETVEGYHCSYGLNREFQAQLVSGPLRVSAVDPSGDVRAVELDDHPFFAATLFQPERAALQDRSPPLIEAFLRACAS